MRFCEDAHQQDALQTRVGLCQAAGPGATRRFV